MTQQSPQVGTIVERRTFIRRNDWSTGVVVADRAPVHDASDGEPSSQWLSTAQAADLLGVKVQTVYAYVSRGNLRARRPSGHGAGGRRSRFDRREVERLAARTRRGGRAGSFEVLVDTELTLLDPAGALYFRGRDACELARSRTFEDVTELLWDCPAGPRPWAVDEQILTAVQAAVGSLGPFAQPVDRCRLAVQVLAGFDPQRGGRTPTHVVDAGRAAIAAAVDVLPRLSDPVSPSVAHRLWAGLSPREPGPAEAVALQAALSLLGDHELAASTLAGRVAASVWADPYLVVLAGLSALSGQLHGAVSGPVVRLLSSALESGDACQAVAEAAAEVASANTVGAIGDHTRAAVPADAQPRSVPGFGHRVYSGVDPRAEALLDLVAPLNPELWPMIDAVLAEGSRVSGREPNIDFALGALTCACGLGSGAGELIFAIARMAGLIGHAVEEYPHRLRFRPRAVYTGPEPGSADAE